MLFSNDCRRKDFQNLRIYRRRYRRYYEIPNVREEPCKNDRANMFLYKLYRKNFVRKSKPPHRGLRRTFWASRSNNKFNSYIKKKNKPLYKFRVHYKMDNYIHSIIKYRFNRRLLVKKKKFPRHPDIVFKIHYATCPEYPFCDEDLYFRRVGRPVHWSWHDGRW